MVSRRQVLSGMMGVAATAGVLRASKAQAQVITMKFAHFADEGPLAPAAAAMAVTSPQRTSGSEWVAGSPRIPTTPQPQRFTLEHHLPGRPRRNGRR